MFISIYSINNHPQITSRYKKFSSQLSFHYIHHKHYLHNHHLCTQHILTDNTLNPYGTSCDYNTLQDPIERNIKVLTFFFWKTFFITHCTTNILVAVIDVMSKSTDCNIVNMELVWINKTVDFSVSSVYSISLNQILIKFLILI